MKRAALVLLALLFALPAFADIDLSGLSFDELAALRDRAQMEMMKRDEWQEVTVPVGVWEIGVDIPAGHYNIRVADNNKYVLIEYGTKLDGSGKGIAAYGTKFYFSEQLFGPDHVLNDGTEISSTDLDLVEGSFLVVDHASVIFTPYTGKPSLGFK